MSTDAEWGDYLAASTPAADAGTGAAASSVEPIAEPVGLPEPAASIVEAEVAGAAAEQGWADWHAAGNDWQDPAAQADAAQGHDETAGDHEIDIADHIATAAGEAIVYEADPGSGF